MCAVLYNDPTNKGEETMSPKLQEVVDFFIVKSKKEGLPLTNKKLQKLIYYAQVWNLVFNDRRLFDDVIEAWIHGPVVPSVYRKYKKYGRMMIDEDAEFNDKIFDKKELDVLEEVWGIYGKFDGDYLEMLSHSEKPWSMARGDAEINEKATAIINIDLMKNYYKEKIKNVGRTPERIAG